jgi:CrcB protein
MELMLVAFGGALGSLSRYTLGRMISGGTRSSFPLGTFFINITGALLLGIVTSINLSGNPYALIGDGFLGAYTTFSTFMYEGFTLFQDNEKLNACIYILGSFALGVLGFMAGVGIFQHF